MTLWELLMVAARNKTTVKAINHLVYKKFKNYHSGCYWVAVCDRIESINDLFCL